jgi:large subunit ribosomal protein L4
VIFGPRKREYNLAMNRKERQLALRTALQSRVEDLVVVEDFQDQLNPPKTRAVAQALLRWGVMEDQSALLIVAERSEAVERAVRNIARVKLIGLDQLNVFDLLNVDWVLITTSALEKLKARWGSGAAAAAPTQADRLEDQAQAAEREARPVEQAEGQSQEQEEQAEAQAQPEAPPAQADQANQVALANPQVQETQEEELAQAQEREVQGQAELAQEAEPLAQPPAGEEAETAAAEEEDND